VVVSEDKFGGLFSTTASSTGSGGAGVGSTVAATSTAGPGGSPATSTAASTGTGEAPAPDEAVSYQITPGHTGALETDTLLPPLATRWTLDLGARVSYPLIADGRVFVTVGSPQVSAKLYAFDLKTGTTDWGPIELDGKHAASYAAYENGRVFTINFNGELRGYKASTGKMLWSTVLKSNMGAFTSAPVALGGAVFITGGPGADAMFTVNQADGALVRTYVAPTPDAWNPPAVSSKGAYFACSYGYVRGEDTTNGSPFWIADQSYVSVDGNNGIVFDGRLYINEGPTSDALVFDAMTGETVGTFDKDATVAFHDGRGFFASGSTLEARSIPSMTSIWKLATGDTIATTPIVVNGRVYLAGASGTLAAIDEQSGTPVWSQDLNLGPSVGFLGDNDSPRSALAAGGGALVVPWGNHLVALW
jgi:outer membrane protein assembly factor BamB